MTYIGHVERPNELSYEEDHLIFFGHFRMKFFVFRNSSVDLQCVCTLNNQKFIRRFLFKEPGKNQFNLLFYLCLVKE